MASTFLKRYEMSRQDFYAKTKQFPQLKTSSDGKLKSSGLANDLKELDALLDAPTMDPSKLTTVFQDFSKHARIYAEQLSFTPGKGVLDWMSKTAPVSDKEKKLIVEQTKAFQNQLEDLIKDVDLTVKSELEKGKSRSQTNAVLKTIQKDVESWDKYLELQGIKVVSDVKTTQILLSPARNQPATDILRAQQGVVAASAEWAKLIGQMKKVDSSPLLPGSVKKSVAAMDEIMRGMMDCVQDLKGNLLQWNNEYKELMKEHEKQLKATPDVTGQQKFNSARQILEKLMPVVDSSKRRIGENVELKVITTRKMLAGLSPK